MMRILLLICFLFIRVATQANLDNLFDQRIATTLQPVSLYQDSSFSAKIFHTFSQGEILEVIGETNLEHEDDSQNQRFKWFQVKNEKGQAGWIFGDALAVIVPEQRLEKQLKTIHKRSVNFNNGFENAVMWIASIEGHDNFNQNNFLNPLYRETYLIITNNKRRSVFIRCAGSSTQGSNRVHDFQLKDLSGDGIAEIILTTKSQTVGSPVENRQLQIFSFQAGTLSNVFEERLTLTYADDQPSPALYKKVLIELPYIRIAYIDYLTCQQYQLPYQATKENAHRARCIEYVTSTHQWNDYEKRFQPLYEESRTAPRALVRNNGIALRKEPYPDDDPVIISRLQKSEMVRVIQHFEDLKGKGVQKTIDPYLFVLLPDGRQGYIPANQVDFTGNEHAELLNRYYLDPPTSKMDWQTKDPFVIID